MTVERLARVGGNGNFKREGAVDSSVRVWTNGLTGWRTDRRTGGRDVHPLQRSSSHACLYFFAASETVLDESGLTCWHPSRILRQQSRIGFPFALKRGWFMHMSRSSLISRAKDSWVLRLWIKDEDIRNLLSLGFQGKKLKINLSLDWAYKPCIVLMIVSWHYLIHHGYAYGWHVSVGSPYLVVISPRLFFLLRNCDPFWHVTTT